MRLLALSGSLRARSSNGAVLNSALDLFEGESTTADIGALPHFNPDLDGEGATPAPSVAALREAAAAADAVLIVSPEYAHALPGVLKNALDWLVSSGEFVGRPTAVITASPFPTGGEHAHAQLLEVLGMLTAELSPATSLKIPAISAKTDPATGRVTDRPTLDALQALMTALAEAAASHSARHPQKAP